jgi:hypothetical protein
MHLFSSLYLQQGLRQHSRPAAAVAGVVVGVCCNVSSRFAALHATDQALVMITYHSALFCCSATSGMALQQSMTDVLWTDSNQACCSEHETSGQQSKYHVKTAAIGGFAGDQGAGNRC